MSTHVLPHFLHKLYPVRLTNGFLESEGIIYLIYVRSQGISEVGEILWIELGPLFMVDHLGYKTICFWNNGLCGRYGHICEEVIETK